MRMSFYAGQVQKTTVDSLTIEQMIDFTEMINLNKLKRILSWTIHKLKKINNKNIIIAITTRKFLSLMMIKSLIKQN